MSASDPWRGHWKINALRPCHPASALRIGQRRLGHLTGQAAIFCPPDVGFPSTGVLAAAEINVPGCTFAEVDIAQISHVRADGVVLNRNHWEDQFGRDATAINVPLM